MRGLSLHIINFIVNTSFFGGGAQVWHMKVHRLGVELELQWLAYHSHSHMGSKLCLRTIPQFTAMPDP